MAKDMNRFDADDSIWFTRQLEYVSSKVLDEPLKPLTYAQFMPVNTEMPLGASNYTWRSYKTYGMARYISDYAKDFPRVGLGGQENSITPKPLGTSYAYTLMDIRKAQFGGFPLDTKLAMAARRSLEEKINSVAWNGDATYNVQGFLNYPGVVDYTVPATGTGSTKTWSTKTADQIITDLNGIIAAVDTATNGIEQPDTILIPKAQMTLIKNMRSSTYSDKTIYEFWTSNNPGISIEVCRELKGAGTGGTDMIVAYTNSSDKLEFVLPQAFEQHEVQRDLLEFVVPITAVVAGVVIYWPLSVAQGYGI